jgi:hypothetical protein
VAVEILGWIVGIWIIFCIFSIVKDQKDGKPNGCLFVLALSLVAALASAAVAFIR